MSNLKRLTWPLAMSLAALLMAGPVFAECLLTPRPTIAMVEYVDHLPLAGKNDNVRTMSELEVQVHPYISIADGQRLLDAGGLEGLVPRPFFADEENPDGFALLGHRWAIGEVREVLDGDCAGQYGPYDTFFIIMPSLPGDENGQPIAGATQSNVYLSRLTSEFISSENAVTGLSIEDPGARIASSVQQQLEAGVGERRINLKVKSADGVFSAQAQVKMLTGLTQSILEISFADMRFPVRLPTVLATDPSFDVNGVTEYESIKQTRIFVAPELTYKPEVGKQLCFNQILEDGESVCVTVAGIGPNILHDRHRQEWLGIGPCTLNPSTGKCEEE